MTGTPPVVRSITAQSARLISASDTVQLCTLAGPRDGSSASVFLEIWEPGGSQPLNSHADSAEIFVILSGRARAHSDEHVVDLGPGDVLILQPGSEHRIVNTSDEHRLHALTIMADDGGFADLVDRGVPVPLRPESISVLNGGER